MSELLQKAESQKMISIPELIEKSKDGLKKAVPAWMNSERLSRIALTCIRTNPELAQCTGESFLGALFTSAQLGIEPIAGRGYLLPFNNSRKVGNDWKRFKEVQFILGYRGIVDLFYRHGKSGMLQWGVVHEKDTFDYELGTEQFLKHRPAEGERGKLKGYWVMADLGNGNRPFIYMTHEEAIEHGKQHSKTFNKKDGTFYKSSPWVTATESMCLKTALVQLSKLLPLSVELQRAVQSDETSRVYQEGVTDILELPDQTNWNDEKENENV